MPFTLRLILSNSISELFLLYFKIHHVWKENRLLFPSFRVMLLPGNASLGHSVMLQSLGNKLKKKKKKTQVYSNR